MRCGVHLDCHERRALAAPIASRRARGQNLGRAVAASRTTRQRDFSATAARAGASIRQADSAHPEATRRRIAAATHRGRPAMSATLMRHFATMAYNNAWANHRLLTACCKLSQADFEAQRTSFFPSIKATLNHNLTVDW